ncbi:hypothetical protein BGX28_006082 [Mortierella sp. GBA30]|nr:hypothetical protein BGX28_006082 [Mortierella sp. GBA30]
MSSMNGRHQSSSSNPILVLEPINESFQLKSLELPEQTKIKIGRQTGVTTAPHPSNGYFDSKVLSRIHAEVWSESGKVYIRDLKSSNGTFLNGKRLCPENMESEPFELNQSDSLEFGIDIMDENGALLHEKVSCKIYISRMTYPTPGSSPQDSHAKLKSSPAGSGVNSVKTNSLSAHGGQSDNMDLILSRLQNELMRSQETYADLGFLKQGISDLEKSLVVGSRETDNKTSQRQTHMNGDHTLVNGLHSTQGANATTIEMEKLKENNQQQAAELSKLQAELESLRSANESLRRGLELSEEVLVKAGLKMERVKDTVNEMAEQHKQELDSLNKDQELTLARLEEKHREEMDRLVHEADSEQAALVEKHKGELDRLRAQLEAGDIKDPHALEINLTELQIEMQSLRQADSTKTEAIRMLTEEKGELIQQLDDTKTELEKTLQLLKDMESKMHNAGLESLTPASSSTSTSSSTAAAAKSEILNSSDNNRISKHAMDPLESTTQSTTESTAWSPSAAPFSWSQFVFPMAKRNQPLANQPSTMLLSGGFVLVGLGVYALWHKAGMTVN